MNLSSKSNGDRIISRGSFIGGLNTTTVPEMIGDNQLAECVNMEFNKSTGALQTCCGSVTIFKAPTDISLTDTFYDKVNNVFIVVDNNRKVYKTHLVDMVGNGTDFIEVGKLSGTLTPMSVMWKNGLLIASGGRLQCWDGNSFDEIVSNFEDELKMYSWNELGQVVSKVEYSPQKNYSFGDIIYRDLDGERKYYKCIVDTSTSEFDSSFTELTIYNEFEFDTSYTRTDVVANSGKYYICNEPHTSISKAPAVCNGVFVKNDRVWVWEEDQLKCSGVGDERMWSDISSDDSSSKWLEIGTLGDIVGVATLSSDMIIITNGGIIYRLAGNYPDWSLLEVARNIHILNPNCYCAIQDGVFILSRNSLFYLQTTQSYGDIEPQNVAVNVTNLFNDLSLEDTKMEFIPSLNQIWITSRGGSVIVFDLTFRAFLQREFRNRVVDLVTNYSSVLLVRADKVTKLMQGIFYDEMFSDDAVSVDWKFTAKSDTSFYDFLLKRVRIAYTPFSENFEDANVIMGKEKIHIPIPEARHTSQPIVNIITPIVSQKSYLFPSDTQFNTKRMVYRDRVFDMKASGVNAPLMINRIDSDIVEV